MGLLKKWPMYFPLVGAKGGSMGLPKKTIFLADFCDEYYSLYPYTKHEHIQAKKKIAFSKW